MRRSVQRQNRKKLNQRRSARALNLFGGRPPKVESASMGLPPGIEAEVQVQVNDKIALLYLPKVNYPMQLKSHQIQAYKLSPQTGELMHNNASTIMVSSVPSLSGYTFTIDYVRGVQSKDGHYVLTRRS
jgi:hypothetical protein